MLSFINYQDILDEDIVFYAHTRNDCKETLKEHIERSEKYFQKLYSDKNVEFIIKRFHQKMHFQNKASFAFLQNLLIQLVSFHDFGKINPKFQEVKMANKMGSSYDGLKKQDHSFLSAIIYIDYFLYQLDKYDFSLSDKILLQRFVIEHAYIIARHHSDMNNLSQFIHDLKETQTKILIQNLHMNPIKGYKGLRCLDDRKLTLLIRNLNRKDRKYTREEHSYKYFYYRLAYSLLVASDYYATSEFMNQKEFDIIGSPLTIQAFQQAYNQTPLMKSIRNYEKNKYQGNRKNFNKITEMNDLRNELFLDAEKSLLENLDKQIYFLQAPTGSGKSNVALNLSFHLIQERKKIFYIYPFNTLVEQNRNSLIELFPQQKYQDQIVVVNSLTPLPASNHEEDSKEYYQKLLLDRQFLNYPFVLSTHVSLFNLLFGSRKEDVIGFHQLSESVIVLDEIQNYKNQIWTEIMIMLEACAELMNLKIIIMSATLPHLEELSGQSHVVKHLLPHFQLYYEHHLFKDRVKLHYDLLEEKMTLEKLKEHIVKTQDANKKILVEFITKESAYQFYKMLKKSDDIYVDVKCLTGDDSIIEREKILSPIKKKQVSSLILIATQVIEAGVDIDMDIGYKDISLLDSEEQFLGRINRSCLNSGDVYFFDYDQYKVIYRGDIRANDSLTLKNEDMETVLLNKDFSIYYHRVMEILKHNRNQRTDEKGLEYFFDELVFKLDYQQISEKMKLIDDDYWSVDVVLCRKIKLDDRTVLDGWEVWNHYKEILQNNEIDYAKKQIVLIKVRCQLNYFIYKFKANLDIQYNDIIGELRCIEDAEEYFVDGKLDREKIGQASYDFL